VVWGVYEASNQLLLIYDATKGEWPSEMLNPLSPSMWQRVFGDLFHTLSALGLSAWVMTLAFLAAPVVMQVLGMVAVWKRRTNTLVLGGTGLMLFANAIELFNKGASSTVWQFEWNIALLGALGWVLACWREVPKSSWFLIMLLVPAVLAQRWVLVVLPLVYVQITWALLSARRHAGAMGQDAEQSDEPAEAQS
jgi:hypothetical protein